MSSPMKTVAVTGVQELSVIPVPIPDCGPTDVLVRVAYCGICGSDVPRYFNGGVHSFRCWDTSSPGWSKTSGPT